ncbi:hypothetical protein DFH09DRAFT_1315166 [Mycena vulgaris]|nr:hypothetical protein DFH09DRAFT_1315166 [Mycena vulgaris]
MDADLIGFLSKMLQSRRSLVRRWPCTVLARLARRETTSAAILEAELTLLSSDNSQEVSESAAEALYAIIISPEGAQAAVDANVLSLVKQFLELNDSRKISVALRLVGFLASHASTLTAVLNAISCARIVSFLP